jgi:hypothetical protein
VGVEIRVGAGVIGEYFLGFCVAVGKATTASAGNVCVGARTGRLMEVGFVSPVQAVIKKQTNKIRINRRFIESKYSGGKLITDEILCYRVPHDT